jgi:rare lipoprotein A
MNSLISRAVVSAIAMLCCPLAMAHVADVDAQHESHKLASADPFKKQHGKASVYAVKFAHQRMANGARFELESNSAASLTLPLGSHARVTNLRNGRSAEVVIRDRGPFVKGRIVDLSPHTARELGFYGVVPVEVERIVPHPKTVVARRSPPPPLMLAWNDSDRLYARMGVAPSAPGIPPPLFQSDLPLLQ